MKRTPGSHEVLTIAVLGQLQHHNQVCNINCPEILLKKLAGLAPGMLFVAKPEPSRLTLRTWCRRDKYRELSEVLGCGGEVELLAGALRSSEPHHAEPDVSL